MSTETPVFSFAFQRLYCDPAVFITFSAVHPICFARVLPFHTQDRVLDDTGLLAAEEAHLVARNDQTRRGVIEAYARCGLLSVADADNVNSVIDYFDVEFFGLMGAAYANAGMHICALRWYREFIQELENQNPIDVDRDGVFPGVGYCLYSLGLFEEAVAWSRSCLGEDLDADIACRELLEKQMQRLGGALVAVDRAGLRIRYIVQAPVDRAQAGETTEQLKFTMKALAPDQEFYFDWVSPGSPVPEVQADGYPFRIERDAGDLPRHKMNLIFALCGQADALIEKGNVEEAKQLLLEAVTIEPEAGFLRERLEALH